jgi:flagellar biosynthesis/type III secretory pathway M-ring protein FliF/YscJ
MKFLPTTADSNFAVLDFFIMVGAVLVPAILALLVWAIFFKNRRRRKRRRKHETSGASQPISQTGGLPPIRKPGNLSDQSQS